MAIRIFQHYWHLHLAVLAVIEGVIFFYAPYAAAILRFEQEPWAEEMLGPMLLTWHNLHYYQELMQGLRGAIAAGTLERFIDDFHAQRAEKEAE